MQILPEMANGKGQVRSPMDTIEEDAWEEPTDEERPTELSRLQVQVRKLKQEVSRIWDDRREHNALMMEVLHSKLNQELVSSIVQDVVDAAVSKTVVARIKVSNAVLESKLQNAIESQAQDIKSLEEQLEKCVSNVERRFCEVFQEARSLKSSAAKAHDEEVRFGNANETFSVPSFCPSANPEELVSPPEVTTGSLQSITHSPRITVPRIAASGATAYSRLDDIQAKCTDAAQRTDRLQHILQGWTATSAGLESTSTSAGLDGCSTASSEAKLSDDPLIPVREPEVVKINIARAPTYSPRPSGVFRSISAPHSAETRVGEMMRPPAVSTPRESGAQNYVGQVAPQTGRYSPRVASLAQRVVKVDTLSEERVPQARILSGSFRVIAPSHRES